MAKKEKRVPAQLEWLDGALPGRIHAEICGSENLLIENYLCVAEFSASRVRVTAEKGILTAEGENLSLCEVRPGSLIVRGRLRTIALPGGECEC